MLFQSTGWPTQGRCDGNEHVRTADSFVSLPNQREIVPGGAFAVTGDHRLIVEGTRLKGIDITGFGGAIRSDAAPIDLLA